MLEFTKLSFHLTLLLFFNTSCISSVFLGLKNHNIKLETYFFKETDLPILGTTQTRGDIRLGGFSGLYFEGINPDNGNFIFLTHPDRGPDSGKDEDDNRIFLLPEFQPEIVKFEFNPNDGSLIISDRLFLTDTQGNPLSGLPNLPEIDPDTPVDENGNSLDYDPLGADLEGIVKGDDGTYWMVDEYRPSIYHFDKDGILIERYVPEGFSSSVGTGALPAVYNTRRANRGFEAIAYQDDKIYAFMQTPLNNPLSKESQIIRILEFDPVTETTVGEYIYVREDKARGSGKIGDAVATSTIGEFLIIESSSKIGSDSRKKIFRISLENASNLQQLPNDILGEGETFEGLTPDQLEAKGINTVSKEIHADLAALDYTFTGKLEGLTPVDENTLAVINDNDFGESDIPIGLGLLEFVFNFPIKIQGRESI